MGFEHDSILVFEMLSTRVDLVHCEWAHLFLLEFVWEPMILRFGDIHLVSNFILLWIIIGNTAQSNIPRQTSSMYR